MRVLITGSRDWDDEDQIAVAIYYQAASKGLLPHEVTVVEGEARGADKLSRKVAEDAGMIVEPHPARWADFHKAAGPIRNQEMVDAGADVALAFYMAGSKGTRDCIERIKAAKIPLTIYPYNFDNGESVDEVDKYFGEDS